MEILIKSCGHLDYAACTFVTLYVSEIYLGLDQKVEEKDLVNEAGEASCASVADLTHPLPPDHPTPSHYQVKAAMWAVGHDSFSLNDN